MAEVSRRGLLGGLVAFVAAPAIVRATSIMPIKPLPLYEERMLRWEGVRIVDDERITLQELLDWRNRMLRAPPEIKPVFIDGKEYYVAYAHQSRF